MSSLIRCAMCVGSNALDQLYDAQLRLALRFAGRRRVKSHIAQDRPNFGTDRVTYPDGVEVARENAHRHQRRPQSMVKFVRALPTITATEFRNPSFGAHPNFGFAPLAPDRVRSAF
jgi:hypothetical protein